MENLLIWSGVIFMIAPFFLWTFLSFLSKKQRKKPNHYKLIILLSILIGLILGAVCFILLFVLF